MSGGGGEARSARPAPRREMGPDTFFFFSYRRILHRTHPHILHRNMIRYPNKILSIRHRSAHRLNRHNHRNASRGCRCHHCRHLRIRY
jgi:hypothetical protein